MSKTLATLTKIIQTKGEYQRTKDTESNCIRHTYKVDKATKVMVDLFDKLTIEQNKKTENSLSLYPYIISFERPKFVSQKNGCIKLTKVEYLKNTNPYA